MSSHVSRNDPCPCGSKKKYKNCHGKKAFRFDMKLFRQIILAVIFLSVAAWAVNRYVLATDDYDTGDTAADVFPRQQSNRVQPLMPQPPGPVPEGKVWSPEHGHWHDAPVTDSGTKRKLTPQPPGLVPPGKVWSPEHGHWHDSSYAGGNFKPGPPPPGPVPEGKVWSYEHGHWHDAQTSQKVQVDGKKSEKVVVGNMDKETLELLEKQGQIPETGGGQGD
jgi:hypothetical protein